MTTVTLTLNPAIDLWSETEQIRPNHKVRTVNDRYDPGGGGINVARVLHNFGAPVVAVALAGGVTGNLLGELLDQEGVPHRLVEIAGRTRINHVVFERRTGHEFRFVLAGPPVSPAEIDEALALLDDIPATRLVISGSLPPGLPGSVMGDIGRRAVARGIKVAVDTSGEALPAAVASGTVDLLKVSLSELESLAGRDLADPADQERVAGALIAQGKVRRVAVSLGGDGAVLIGADGTWRRAAPPVQAISTVGAGDSFLAALVWSLDRGDPPGEALAWGVAAGAAAVSKPGTRLCQFADVERIHGPAPAGLGRSPA
ncbi:1-phosphofructokinase family hexose kinase [Prosthecodimorpha staleyi]|uniref:Phosphofructokinase n=1 Tax=Prosthecodimorpha staleyi TaxID=2840188 RepID=A0A947GD16_9HYPH|nr:1-phosphofructokinase family hexose kinase [Prosthecodimorpha staleyi]MBT9290357.1 1-phosphofructokinase family hexose kinase [Prosthecodimorpha staleyi]